MATRNFMGLLLLLNSTLCAAADAAPGGSLIDPDQYRGVAADRKAYRVGDTLTVVVMESAQAQSNAATNVANDSGVDVTAKDPSASRGLGLNVSGNADGTGKTSRQGQLQAALSVRVISVEPNNLLHVKGEQTITINGEAQKITVDGMVRTEDIAQNDTILSSRLSDAKIEFTGDGVVSESQKTGVIYRFFHWLGII